MASTSPSWLITTASPLAGLERLRMRSERLASAVRPAGRMRKTARLRRIVSSRSRYAVGILLSRPGELSDVLEKLLDLERLADNGARAMLEAYLLVLCARREHQQRYLRHPDPQRVGHLPERGAQAGGGSDHGWDGLLRPQRGWLPDSM